MDAVELGDGEMVLSYYNQESTVVVFIQWLTHFSNCMTVKCHTSLSSFERWAAWAAWSPQCVQWACAETLQNRGQSPPGRHGMEVRCNCTLVCILHHESFYVNLKWIISKRKWNQWHSSSGISVAQMTPHEYPLSFIMSTNLLYEHPHYYYYCF